VPQWEKIALAGVGLLGGSLGLAIRQRSLAGSVVGLVRREASVTECIKLGVVTDATTDPHRAVAAADFIILCTPISRMRMTLEPMLPSLKRGAIVTDVGSVKASVVQELESLVAQAGGHFIGSHPMAGAERAGPSAARADLFMNAVCVITPTPQSSPEAVRKVEEFWTAAGGNPLRMTPELHDDLVSRSSHLPHVVAAGLANLILSPAHPKEQAQLCANGFRDTTRIASGSPEMWRDIAIANRKHLARALGVFIKDLQEFKLAIENGDSKVIGEFFEQARQRRDQWSGQTASPSPE
jgi:prephenate dehydrogenase